MQDMGTAATQERDDTAVAMGRQHVRGSALLVVGRVLAMALNMATQVVIVRALTKADFGAFAYALALANAGSILLSLGQGRVLSRFLATYEEEKDYPRMFGAMFLSVGTILATSTVGIGLMFLFRDQLIGSGFDSQDAVQVVLILVFLSPLEALDQVFVSLFAVFSAPRAIFVRKYLMAPAVRLAVVVVCVVTGAGVSLLALGYVFGALLGLVIYTWLLIGALRRRGLLRELRSGGVVVPYRAVFVFSFPMITGELAFLSLALGGVVVLGMYHSTTEVADYRAVFSAARLNTAVTTSFATLFLPMIAKLHARGNLSGLRDTYWQTAVFVAVFTFPIFALTGPLSSATTVTLFGERYAGSATILSVLAIGYYVSVVLGFNAYALQVCGRIRYLVFVNILIAVGNIGLCFALAPRYGAIGAAAANCIIMVSQNLLNQAALRKSLRSGLVSRSCWGAYAAILAAVGTLWVFELVASPGIVLSIAAAALASLGVLVASRRALQLGDTFPELRRVPLVRWVIQ